MLYAAVRRLSAAAADTADTAEAESGLRSIHTLKGAAKGIGIKSIKSKKTAAGSKPCRCFLRKAVRLN